MNNSRALILFAALACCLILLVKAGPIPEDEITRMGMRRAFRESSNFFANQIERAQQAAEDEKNVKSLVKETSAKFQKAIDANKGAPVPRPTNPEVNVYLKDEPKADDDNGDQAVNLSVVEAEE